jgi:hypothetical protein
MNANFGSATHLKAIYQLMIKLEGTSYSNFATSWAREKGDIKRQG